jgi:hypothetical protein
MWGLVFSFGKSLKLSKKLGSGFCICKVIDFISGLDVDRGRTRLCWILDAGYWMLDA